MIQLVPWLERQWSFNLPVGAFPAVLERLRGTPARAAELVGGLPEASLAARSMDKWSAKEHLGHLSDLYALDVRRLEEFLSGAKVLSPADMLNRRTAAGSHRTTPVAQLLSTLRQQRESFTLALEKLTEVDIGARALHSRLGVTMRLIDWTQFVAEHDDHHLASARNALRPIVSPFQME